MKTIGDFITALSALNHITATFSIQMWREGCPKQRWSEYVNMPLTLQAILCVREQMSCFYAQRVENVSCEEYYQNIIQEHAVFIKELDSLAAKAGYTITEMRMCISYAEAMERRDLIVVSAA